MGWGRVSIRSTIQVDTGTFPPLWTTKQTLTGGSNNEETDTDTDTDAHRTRSPDPLPTDNLNTFRPTTPS